MRPTIKASLLALQERRTTAEKLLVDTLDRASRNVDLNALALIDAEAALAAARLWDRKQAAGEAAMPLHGIPLTVKDLFVVDSLPTRAGTQAPLPPLGPEGAAVARLRAAGAILFAKTNMHEVALGLTGENAWTGDVRNPRDPSRQAGGSSSGSGAAVAAGIGLGSLGSDTGGSIRVPAALCGITGFKPTYGLIPLDGALPLAPTCDHAGPLATDVADVRLLTEVMAACPLPPAALPTPLRLGIPRAYLDRRLTTAMRNAFDDLLDRLQAAGAELVDVTIDGLDRIIPVYSTIVRAEAARVHRRALEQDPTDFSVGVRTPLLGGMEIKAVDYLDARAGRAQITAGLDAAFRMSGAAALILPATPAPAQPLGSDTVELEAGHMPQREAQLALTAPFSLVGAPALSLPFAEVEGLPVGVQVVTSWHEDARALDVGAWLEALASTGRESAG